jgi:hypothetical protein
MSRTEVEGTYSKQQNLASYTTLPDLSPATSPAGGGSDSFVKAYRTAGIRPWKCASTDLAQNLSVRPRHSLKDGQSRA